MGKQSGKQRLIEQDFWEHVTSGRRCGIILQAGTPHTKKIIRRIKKLAPDDYVIVYKHEVNTPEGAKKYDTGRIIIALI